ncbi:hypothetical protein AB0I02_27315 [Streptomyces phaeochromogenes]
MTEIGDRVSRLCAAMSEADAWADCAEAGASDILREIVTAIRTGTAADDRAGWSDEELARALDTLDAAMAAADYGYLTRPTRTYPQLPGESHCFRVDLWVCPATRPCTRSVRARDADGAACEITGQGLRKIRLSS